MKNTGHAVTGGGEASRRRWKRFIEDTRKARRLASQIEEVGGKNFGVVVSECEVRIINLGGK